MSGNVHEAEVTHIATIARDVLDVTFTLVPPELTDNEAVEPLSFRPGQFISLRVGIDEDDDPILRSYSLASEPGSTTFHVVVKVFHDGVGSRWFRALTVGTRVHFTGPMGFFVLDFAHPGDVVFGATGVGITPFLPMLHELQKRNEPGRVILYWSFRDVEERFWEKEMAALSAAMPRLSIHYHLTGEAPSPLPPWVCEPGRINQAILRDLPTFTNPVFYLCGNALMLKEVKTELQALGIDRKKQIRTEAFYK